MAVMAQRTELHSGRSDGYLMHGLIWIPIFLVIFSSCGYHKQSRWRKDVQDPAKLLSESDPLKQAIGAIYRGDLDKVGQVLETGLDVNSHNTEGLTLLMVALKARQLAVIDLLLERGALVELKTQSEDFTPPVSAVGYMARLQSDSETKMSENIYNVMLGILKKEPFSTEQLDTFIFSGIDDKNVELIDWVLKKGGNPNAIFMTGDNKDKPKYSALIYVLSQEGVRDVEIEGKKLPHFTNLKKIFDLLVNHPEIDLNLKVRRYTPLKRAKRRAKKDSRYAPWVDQLVALGATR